MTQGLIEYLTYAYSYLHRGRRVLRGEDASAIMAGTATVVRTAPAVLAEENAADQDDTLREAQLIQQHIEESVQWLLTLENN